jgi:CheY-like chemotaxis protein
MNQARKEIARPKAGSAPRILVVEDESDLALLLAYNLKAEGYLVESVERGDEAELRLAESALDLVILDWVLPGVSGLEICRRLRARETTRTLPVIMVTALGDAGRASLSAETGFVHRGGRRGLPLAALAGGGNRLDTLTARLRITLADRTHAKKLRRRRETRRRRTETRARSGMSRIRRRQARSFRARPNRHRGPAQASPAP